MEDKRKRWRDRQCQRDKQWIASKTAGIEDIYQHCRTIISNDRQADKEQRSQDAIKPHLNQNDTFKTLR